MDLSRLDYGVILISHSRKEPIEISGKTIQRNVPNVPAKLGETVSGFADFIFYFDFEPKEGGGYNRVIRTKPDFTYEAGDRTAKLPKTLPMKWDSLESAFAKAVGGK